MKAIVLSWFERPTVARTKTFPYADISDILEYIKVLEKLDYYEFKIKLIDSERVVVPQVTHSGASKGDGVMETTIVPSPVVRRRKGEARHCIEKQQKILEIIRNGQRVDTLQVTKICGYPYQTTYNQLIKMKDKGLIHYTHKRLPGGWVWELSK